MNFHNADREKLVKIFEDTLNLSLNNDFLKKSVETSIKNSVIYDEKNYPDLPTKRFDSTKISVNKYRTFETAQFYAKKFPDKKISVLNFASATNVGGGVTKGSKAQEESLCRCSTLYPVLNTENNLKNFYEYHRKKNDARYTDKIIFSPEIFIFKSDTDFPQILPENKFVKVDVITCSAPNLRLKKISDDELFKIHLQRAKHILTVAAHHKTDFLILGAFGCGAFQNNPYIVAESYKEILKNFKGYFQEIIFAIYCPPHKNENFIAFKKNLTEE